MNTEPVDPFKKFIQQISPEFQTRAVEELNKSFLEVVEGPNSENSELNRMMSHFFSEAHD
ncbi:MAG: hypothetical protein ACE5E9_12670 [Nitrospinaceae bacterium]